MDATLFTKAGFLRINVTSSLGQIPVKDATVSITYTGEPGRGLEELTTDESGLTDTIVGSDLLVLGVIAVPLVGISVGLLSRLFRQRV